MISYAKAYHLATLISTNVTLLDKNKAAGLIGAGLDIIIFAVDGSTRGTYEKIRAGAQYEKVIDNIHGFLEKKTELKKRNPFVVLQLIEMEENRHEIAQFKQYWADYPVRVFIKPSTDYRRKVTVPKNQSCDRLWYQSLILSDGSVVPCCMDINGEYSLGSIRDRRFFDMWNGNTMKEIRKKESQRRFELCRKCNYVTPRKHNLVTSFGLLSFNMGIIARMLYIMGYAKQRQL
jgi:radical SAM protein with 4Fe4S-binding SPASM domain